MLVTKLLSSGCIDFSFGSGGKGIDHASGSDGGPPILHQPPLVASWLRILENLFFTLVLIDIKI